MSPDRFGKIPPSPEMQAQILQAELDIVEDNLEVVKQYGHDISHEMLKGLIKRKEYLSVKLGTIQYKIEKDKGSVVDFKQMAIDSIFVDESHQFKNLMLNTRHERVAGLDNCSRAMERICNGIASSAVIVACRQIDRKSFFGDSASKPDKGKTPGYAEP